MAEPPHILTLTCSDDYDPDTPLFWTDAALECPYQPMRADVPCAALLSCGCPPDDGYDDVPCPASPTGVHQHWEGESVMPTAECWAVNYAGDLEDAAAGLAVGPGRYEVWPVCDEGGLLYLATTPPVEAATEETADA